MQILSLSHLYSDPLTATADDRPSSQQLTVYLPIFDGRLGHAVFDVAVVFCANFDLHRVVAEVLIGRSAPRRDREVFHVGEDCRQQLLALKIILQNELNAGRISLEPPDVH